MALADLAQMRFVTGRVKRVLAQLPGAPDVVVLDPPQSGIGREVALAVAERGPTRIVHVACDPASLARDIAAYLEGGYRLLAGPGAGRVPDDPPRRMRRSTGPLTPSACG